MKPSNLFGVLSGIVLAASVTVAAGQIPTAYEIQVIDIRALNAPQFSYNRPKGINDLGQVLFGEKSGAKGVWDPSGAVYPVPMNTADAFNNSGWVVGHGPDSAVARGIKDNTYAAAYNIYTGQNVEVPTWLDDRPDLIPSAGTINQNRNSVETKLFAVNDAGVAVGRTKSGENPRWQPFAYDINSGEYSPLKRSVPVGTPGSRQAYVDEMGGDAINNNALVLGSEEIRSGTGLGAVVWNQATDSYSQMSIIQLPDATGATPGPGSQGGSEISLNNNNTVLMQFDSGEYGLVDVDALTGSTQVRLTIPLENGASYLGLQDLTDDDVVLGFSGDGSGHVLWSESTGYVGVQNLLGSAWSGWTLTDLAWINNNYQIVGMALDPSGAEQFVLLNPVAVPEPGTLVLMAMGMGTACVLRFRRKKAVRRL